MAMNANTETWKSPVVTALEGYYTNARARGRMPGFSWAERWAHWGLRIPMAALLFYYGMQKFPAVFTAPGDQGVPAILFILAAFAEILGPIAIVLGGIVETIKPSQRWLRLAGDFLSRAGGFAAVAAIGGVIYYFYWGGLLLSDPHVMYMGLALFLMLRGNRYTRSKT